MAAPIRVNPVMALTAGRGSGDCEAAHELTTTRTMSVPPTAQNHSFWAAGWLRTISSWGSRKGGNPGAAGGGSSGTAAGWGGERFSMRPLGAALLTKRGAGSREPCSVSENHAGGNGGQPG